MSDAAYPVIWDRPDAAHRMLSSAAACSWLAGLLAAGRLARPHASSAAAAAAAHLEVAVRVAIRTNQEQPGAIRSIGKQSAARTSK